MKLSRFLVGTLACTLFAACSNEENSAINSGQEEGQLSYVAVNIVNANPTGSRVDGGEYEDGKGPENTITKARFYLFDASGNPYTVTTNEAPGAVAATNYVDITALDDQGKDDPNVESIKKGVLVFKGTTTELPTSIVAVLNPPTDLTGSKSLSDLQTAIADYSSTTSFVMSNSVYASEGTEVVATDIVGKVAQNKEDAEANPVDIYVERVLAKVRVTFSNADKENQYKVSEDGEPAVYAKILGWAVTRTADKSNLLKDIDPAWDDMTLGFTWNDEPFHRSYWATTSTTVTLDKKTETEIINDQKPTTPEGATNISVPRYCQENTKANEHTEVVVVAQLVNEEGNPNPIYKYFGEEHDSEEDILTLIANKYNNVYYTRTGGTSLPEGGTEYEYESFITPDNIHFEATTPETGGEDYEAIAQLDDDALNGVTIYIENPVYNGENEKYIELADAEATINEELAKNPAQIATEGYVYYYTPIKHLGTITGSTGEYGVVRNHVYAVTITDIKGYGTPIFDPDKDIDTTHPSNEEVYIAARINVLSWRVVSSNVTLE
ncbi:Mfa1 family fimbria major subunit [Bacteroides gallinaceum]|uniref:Mfa1 family fimbria major subunit n=1 Tax=Bacteroides gallinaceum TaxID=1462571 RepID=UPI0025A338B6|nr:Mfa1 family fimbria major subunit [Bacteroides gallinaceum]MDM8153095.1 Mfa1 family fimbria major subunit [Bacteroides gallinaceum]